MTTFKQNANFWSAGLLSLTLLLLTLALSACSFGANQDPLPDTIWPDASTPANLSQFNGGIIADATVSGYRCNIVTDNVAKAVEKWQGNRNGFFRVKYAGNELWAIEKGVMFKFDTGQKP